MASLREILFQADKKILASPEYQIHRRNESLVRSYYIFDVNFHVLEKYNARVNAPHVALSLWSEGKQAELYQTNMEMNRHFYNFLSASLSLVDHVRKFMKKYYSDTQFYSDYEKKVEEDLNPNGIHTFVQCLRNKYIHYEIIKCSQTLEVGNIIRNQYLFDVEQIRQSLNEKERRWLDNQKETPSITSLAQSYYSIISVFYQWFFSEVKKLHEDDYATLNRLYAEASITKPFHE